jgi:NADH oxidase (H2O2-forming)
MSKKVVIIGGGAAGIDVLELLLRGQKEGDKLEITLIKKEEEGFLSMCALPFAWQGMVDMEKLNVFRPSLYREKGVDFRTGTEVVDIFLDQKSVVLKSGEEILYDYLVIATGSRPLIPPIPGTDLLGIYTLSTSSDGARIDSVIKSPDVEEAVIIGAGWIGLQTAVAFSQKGKNTTVVEGLPHILPATLDPDMASIVKNWLEGNLNFLLGSFVQAIKGDGRVESVMVKGQEIPADVVVITAGMRPQVDLAKKAGLEVGESGGIITDRTMHVRRSGSYLKEGYSLGDCAEVIDAVTFRPRLSQLASTALTQARVVADNILGLGSSYETCISPSVANISGLQVGSVGVTSEIAKRYGIPIRVGKAARYTKARFFPGTKPIFAKLIFEAQKEKLIGAQIISEETVAERINELTLGIRAGISPRDIYMRERCFEPSLSMVEDVLVEAAMKAVES